MTDTRKRPDRCTFCGRFMSIWEEWAHVDDPDWNSYSLDPPEQLPAHPKCESAAREAIGGGE